MFASAAAQSQARQNTAPCAVSSADKTAEDLSYMQTKQIRSVGGIASRSSFPTSTIPFPEERKRKKETTFITSK
eukprot:467108-Pelagomonas_calceolata.AAC.5